MTTSTEPAWFGFARQVMQATPFFAEIGAQFLDFGGGVARARLPYDARLVGDPDTGVLHGGAITAVLDHIGGGAVLTALADPAAIATLDLRIDYMKPADPHVEILAEAHCVRVSHEIAFVRGSAYQADPEKPLALFTAAFMLIRGALAFPVER
jgi:uncharacterized protein (TIGR00369 family)